jgi:hypothetical protein
MSEWDRFPAVKKPGSEWDQFPVVSKAAPSPAAPPETQGKSDLGFWGTIKDAFTGESRTEFKDAPEFEIAMRDAGDNEALGAVRRSAVTPDQNAQLDILKRQIPGLEVKTDAHGNIMLKTPQQADWAYLNKPGLSGRDVGEFGTQTLATLPFLGVAGMGRNLLRKVGSGIAAMTGASVAQDAAAIAQGSEQGVDEGRAAVSGAVGAALPLAAPAIEVTSKAVKSAVSPVTSVIRGLKNPEQEAARRVGAAASRDFRMAQDTGAGRGTANTPDAEIRAAGRNGQPVRAIDMGETTRALARSAANTSPEGRAIITDAVQGRYQQQSDRLAGFLETISPFKGSTFQLSETIARVAKNARKHFYEKAYQDGAGGVYSPVLSAMVRESPALQKAAKSAYDVAANKAAAGQRVELHGNNGHTLQFWDYVKQALDDQIGALQRAGEKQGAADLIGIKHRLVEELDAAVPSYRTARGVAGTYFKAADALEAGENFVKMKVPNGEAAHAFGKLTANEQILFRQGYIQTLMNDLRATGDTRNALNKIMNSPVEREKMELVLGAADSKKLEGFLRMEGIMDLARNALGNSTTARQLAEMGLAGGAYNAATGTTPWSDPVGFFTSALLFGGARAGMARIDQNVARQVAELLVTDDPKRLAQAVKMVQQPWVMNALRAFDEYVGPRMARNAAAQQATQPEASASAAPQRFAALDAMAGEDEELAAARDDARADLSDVLTEINALNPGYAPGQRQSSNVIDRRGEKFNPGALEKLRAFLFTEGAR